MGYLVNVDKDVHLFVEDLNPKGHKTIVFLHGWPFSHKQFEYQFDVLPKMGYRCIGIDWRGYGNSDKPINGYHYDRLADDIHAVIEALQLDNITLAGHSTGGAIAVHYVARYHGHRVSKLVLINAAVPKGLSKEMANRLLTETLNDRPQMIRGVIDSFFFQYITKPFADQFFQIGLQAAGWSTAAILKTLRDENLGRDLPKIQVPTLIVHGIHDQIVPFAQAKEMHDKIKDAHLVPFQYSGHGTFWEERDKFNKLLVNFTNDTRLHAHFNL
jgi:non-heme chloroperoxidase